MRSGLDMALSVGDQGPSDTSDSSWPSSYRLFRDFRLEEPEKHLGQEALNRLREVEPQFRDLEIRLQPGKPPIYSESRVFSHPSRTLKIATASIQS